MLIIRRIELYQYVIWYISLSVEWYVSDDALIQLDSADDEHWIARNMYRSEINKLLKKVRQVGY